MIVNPVAYSSEIENWILANLDGWRVEVPYVDPTTDEVETSDNVESGSTSETETTNETGAETTTTTTTDEANTGINPFMTSSELEQKANKVITSNECQLFYEETLDLAYMHTNRLNIEDLTSVEARMFIRAVCKWTASNLWNKYNIRVNNEDMEDTYVQSYGGLLYKSALKALQPFINQRITGMNALNNSDDDNDIWIV